MKRIILFIATIICACLNSKAQINQVYNPSFEDHWRCPQYINLVKYANYWTAIEDTVVSDTDTLGFPPYLTDCKPEYCNVCSSYPMISVPSAITYFHTPRTGSGMMHLIAYYNEEFPDPITRRDYLQGRLKKALDSGRDYCVTFFVLQAGGSRYSINHIGAYFDDATIDTTTNCGMVQSMHIPQIFGSDIVTDTTNWTKIQGYVLAGSDQKFITLGNFFDADHTDTIQNFFSHAYSIMNSYLSYYLVDDVSVIKVGTTAYAGADTTIDMGDTVWVGNHDGYLPVKWYSNGALIDSNHAGFAVHPDTTTSYVMELDVCGTITYDTMTVTVRPLGIAAQTLGGVHVYPNPAKDELNISGLMGAATYTLRSLPGVTVATGSLNKASGKISLTNLPTGVYLLELVSSNCARRVERVVKE